MFWLISPGIAAKLEIPCPEVSPALLCPAWAHVYKGPPTPEQSPCTQGLPACCHWRLKTAIWTDIHPPWGKSATNHHLLSHPDYLIPELWSELLRVVTGSGNDGKDCNNTKAAFPVSIAPVAIHLQKHVGELRMNMYFTYLFNIELNIFLKREQFNHLD